MSLQWFAIAYALVLLIISSRFYDHTGAKYRRGKKEPIHSRKEFKAVYRYLQISTPLVYGLSLLFPANFAGTLFSTPATIITGLSIMSAGILLFVASKRQLGIHYSPCFDSFVPSDVVREGVYRYIRHPIYTANVILLAGYFIASGHILILFNTLLLATYYLHAAVQEERVLAKNFSEYREYQGEAGMFLPKKLVPAQRSRPSFSHTRTRRAA